MEVKVSISYIDIYILVLYIAELELSTLCLLNRATLW